MENQVMCLILSFVHLVMQIIFLSDKVTVQVPTFPSEGRQVRHVCSFCLFCAFHYSKHKRGQSFNCSDAIPTPNIKLIPLL